MTRGQRRLLTGVLLTLAVLCFVGATLPVVATLTGLVPAPVTPAEWVRTVLQGLPPFLLGLVMLFAGLYARGGGYD